MILYHGSNLPIDTIDLLKSKKAKDFGQGFYLSQDKAQAQKMAELTTFRTNKGTPTITAFDFDENHFHNSSLNVKIFDGYSEEWAHFIFLNRKNDSITPAHSYDIVIGPIADDTVGVQIRRFIMGYIDIHQLVKELSYISGPTIQYFFGTEKSIKLLKKLQ